MFCSAILSFTKLLRNIKTKKIPPAGKQEGGEDMS